MKKTILLSAMTVSILFGTALSANSYQDSLSLKESKAIKNSEVKGEDAAIMQAYKSKKMYQKTILDTNRLNLSK